MLDMNPDFLILHLAALLSSFTRPCATVIIINIRGIRGIKFGQDSRSFYLNLLSWGSHQLYNN